MNSLKLLIPLSILMVLGACDFKTEKEKEKEAKATAEKMDIAKGIREIRYVDGGAVVPLPMTRTISINVKDSSNAILTYMECMGSDTSKSDVNISKERIEMLYDCMIKMVEIPDGMEIIPGKVPCVGRKGIEVSMIFNTGDTSRFKINGGALCDRDVIPEWKQLDSLATVIYKEYKAAH